MIKRVGSHMGFGWIYAKIIQFEEVDTGCEVMGINMLVFLEGKGKDFCQLWRPLCFKYICILSWYNQ